MKKVLATFATPLVCCTLMAGTGIAQNTPAIITPTDATHLSGIAPNGIGATTSQLLFSQPYCGPQARGVYSASTPTANGTVYTTNITPVFGLPNLVACPSATFGGSENYFVISPGLPGFPAGSVYATDPETATTSDAVYKDGAPFITGIADNAPGHAGITLDTVGTFQNALIVTTASQVVGFNGTGTQLFNYTTPVGFLLESASVAPLTNTACPGCLYVTATKLPLGNNLPGAIYTIAPNTPSGTAISTLVTSTPAGQTEPESILFVPPQVCTLNGTNFSYFVSAYAANDQRDNVNTNNGDLLAFTQAQVAPFVGQALVPFEGGVIYTFNPTTHIFTPFSTPVPIPAGNPGLYQLEGASLVACPPATGTGCPATQGFWKHHSILTAPLTIGGVSYTNAQLVTILNTAPQGGNAALILMHQLIAAVANEAAGAQHTAAADAAISQAEGLIAANSLNFNSPTFVDSNSTLGAQMIALANILDNYNSAVGLNCSEASGLTF